MTKAATLFALFATFLALASAGIAPAAAPEESAQTQQISPTPLHSLTGIAFHASAAGF